MTDGSVGKPCQEHKDIEPVNYRTILANGRYLKYMMCGHDGCIHEYIEDATEKMAQEFNG